jgi:hypothetical protein
MDTLERGSIRNANLIPRPDSHHCRDYGFIYYEERFWQIFCEVLYVSPHLLLFYLLLSQSHHGFGGNTWKGEIKGILDDFRVASGED